MKVWKKIYSHVITTPLFMSDVGVRYEERLHTFLITLIYFTMKKQNKLMQSKNRVISSYPMLLIFSKK